MEIKLKKEKTIVYNMTWYLIEVDIDGVEYGIQVRTDDNGCEYYVQSENLNDGDLMDVHDIEDDELQEIILKLASSAHDEYLFSAENVGKDIALEDLEDFY